MSDTQTISQDYAPTPKRIKLVISDLHLGKGKKLPGGGTNPLEEFFFEEKLVEFIQYHSTGKYENYEVELIINGDFLNFLQTDFRGHYLTVITESVTLENLKEITAGHPKAVQALKQFAAMPGKSITYVIGNHDQGMLWPAAREFLDQLLETKIKFKNLVYYFDGVHIEHGHMHESANRFDPKKFFLKKDLPEPILNLPFGSHFFIDFVMKMKLHRPHIDKVRPFGKMLRWALINETWFTIKALVALLWYFLKSAFIRDPSRSFPLKRILKVFFESAIFPDLSESARQILEDDRVHTVVFGHTHVYQYRQWGEGKEYFNTGTWTEITSLDVSSLGKITKLTFVEFVYPEDGSRPRGSLKEWKGFHRVEEDVVTS